MTNKKFKILIEDQEFIIPFIIDEDILSALLKKRIPISHSCGGMGTCGTCRLIVSSGIEKFNEPNIIEQEMIRDRGFVVNERLACQNTCVEDVCLEVPPPRNSSTIL